MALVKPGHTSDLNILVVTLFVCLATPGGLAQANVLKLDQLGCFLSNWGVCSYIWQPDVNGGCCSPSLRQSLSLPLELTDSARLGGQ